MWIASRWVPALKKMLALRQPIERPCIRVVQKEVSERWNGANLAVRESFADFFFGCQAEGDCKFSVVRQLPRDPPCSLLESTPPWHSLPEPWTITSFCEHIGGKVFGFRYFSVHDRHSHGLVCT